MVLYTTCAPRFAIACAFQPILTVVGWPLNVLRTTLMYLLESDTDSDLNTPYIMNHLMSQHLANCVWTGRSPVNKLGFTALGVQLLRMRVQFNFI
jgi:hypothetical protein